jgi:5-methylcytosine-specific restriction endonuclease McrA
MFWCLKCDDFRVADGLPACPACRAPGPRLACTCVDRWGFRTSNDAMRSVIFKRDDGICSACGLDCKRLDPRFLREQASLADRWQRGDKEARRKAVARGCRLRPDGTPTPAEDWAALIPGAVAWLVANRVPIDEPPWNLDHRIPICAGGDWFRLDNIFSMCVPDHRIKSKADAARCREARRRVDPIQAL